MKKVTPFRQNQKAGSAAAEKQSEENDSRLDELEQVRELLFGQQNRAQHDRADQIQKQLQTDVDKLESALESKFSLLNKNLDKLGANLDRETKKRENANSESKDRADAIAKSVENLSDRVDAENKKLTSMLNSEANRLEARTEQHEKLTAKQHDEMVASMEARLKEERLRIAETLKTMAAALIRD